MPLELTILQRLARKGNWTLKGPLFCGQKYRWENSNWKFEGCMAVPTALSTKKAHCYFCTTSSALSAKRSVCFQGPKSQCIPLTWRMSMNQELAGHGSSGQPQSSSCCSNSLVSTTQFTPSHTKISPRTIATKRTFPLALLASEKTKVLEKTVTQREVDKSRRGQQAPILLVQQLDKTTAETSSDMIQTDCLHQRAPVVGCLKTKTQ